MEIPTIEGSELEMEPRTTLAQLLTDPESSAPAIIAPSPAVVVSYKSLAEQVERLASQLSGAGLKAGEVVAIVLPNGLEFLVVFLALTRARLVAAPINPADKSDELRFFIAAGQARAVIAESGNSRPQRPRLLCCYRHGSRAWNDQAS